MSSKLNIYFHLLLSIALIPAILYGGEIIKGMVMVYAVWLTFKKDASTLPALAVITSFLSNSNIIYFGIIVLTILNFNRIRSFGVHQLLIILLIFLPYVLFQSVFKVFVLHIKAGLVLTQFQLYFSMFAFFYGLLIKDTFDKKIMKILILTLVLLYLLNIINLFNSDFVTVRLFFYTIPFFAGFLSYYIFSKGKNDLPEYLIIGLIILLSSVIFSESTFTIYITTLFAFLISAFYFRKKKNILLRLTGVPAFIIVFLLLIYAITGFEKNDYSMYRELQMTDVNSYKSFTDRLSMKFFDDRAPIWVGVYDQITTTKNWLPPFKVEEIEIAKRNDKTINFEFHSHNVYLELLRTNGIIMGIVLSLIFISFALLGRKIFSLPNIDPLFIIFISASLSTMIIGSLTGIYVLLPTYAMLSLSIVGIAYATFKNRTQNRLSSQG